MMEEKEKEKAAENQAPQETEQEKREEAQKQAEYYKDLFLRKAAEFENFKRRSEAESVSIVKFANEDLLLAILPVIDDLERSLKQGKDRGESGAFYKGVELIHQKMLKILEGQGVKPFETVGKEFNVEFHDALLQVPKDGVPPHTVIEEVEKGYLYHEKVLRHAKVIVSSAPVEADSGSPQAGGGDGVSLHPEENSPS